MKKWLTRLLFFVSRDESHRPQVVKSLPRIDLALSYYEKSDLLHLSLYRYDKYGKMFSVLEILSSDTI